jgi:hypothetical protein
MNGSVHDGSQPPDEDISTVYEAEVSITVGEVAVCVRGSGTPEDLTELCFKTLQRLNGKTSKKQCLDCSVG